MHHTKTPTPIPGLAKTAAILSAALLAGCMSPPPQGAKSLSEPDLESLKRIQQIATAESRHLLEKQEVLLREMQVKAAPKPLLPTAPVYDPLEGKTISVAVANGTISQILTAFSDAAKVNLIVEPAVVQQGARSDMFLKDVSLREAFNELLQSYDVSGEIRNQTMRIKLHEEKIFSLNFLNITSQMSLSSGGNVFGANGGAGGSAIAGNLSMSASAGTRSDPYTEIENNLKAILGEERPEAAPAKDGKDAQDPAQVPQPNQQQSFTLNRTSGVLFVKARPSQMRSVERILKRTQDMLTRQVYIEAQIIDVQLGDGYQFGIDWSQLRSRLALNFGSTALDLLGGTASMPNGGGANPPSSVTIPSRLVGAGAGQTGGGVAYQDNNGTTVINALRSFGNLRVLSNPNIQVRNGTPAMLSVGTSERYVSKSSSAQNNVGGGSSTTSSEVQTDAVFSGVMVGVLPMISDDGRIELLINPVQSDVDPSSLALVSVNDANRVSLPKVAYKGLTTTLNLNDGDVIVVGGLIDQKSSGTNAGLPFLSDIPLFGKLVTREGTQQSARELIIVLRVRIL
jgi:MSHA type pilus biogenesis protein MshL